MRATRSLRIYAGELSRFYLVVDHDCIAIKWRGRKLLRHFVIIINNIQETHQIFFLDSYKSTF
jgi:hypothetical protein